MAFVCLNRHAAFIGANNKNVTLNNNKTKKKTLSSCFDIVKNTIIQNLLEIL